jgi:hypothetical protein
MAKKDKDGLWHGREGNTIFYVVNGLQRSRSVSKDFNDAETPRQKMQREKLIMANKHYSVLKPVLKFGLQATSNSKIQSEFISAFTKNAIIEYNGALSIDYSRIRLSRGLIPCPANITANRIDNKILLSWDTAVFDNMASNKDTLLVCLLNDKNLLWTYETAATRQEGAVSLTLPAKFKGHFNLYSFFHNPMKEVKESREKISDSVYLGRY